MTKLPIGEDETDARHQQTVEELKKDRKIRSRAQVTEQAQKILRQLHADLATGLEHFSEAGDPLDIDHALAHALAGKTVQARKPPKDEPILVTKGPPIGLEVKK